MGVKSLGFVGLAVMGQNLVLNIEEKGFEVVVYNRTKSKTDSFVRGARGKNISAAYSIKELVEKLPRPRVVMVMVKAGRPVDLVIEQLAEFLEPGDLILDNGNSFFRDTNRRSEQLAEKGIHFLGVGISGGEEGARNCPSIMPGGSKEGYVLVESLFNCIAASYDNVPCVSFLGEKGSGHFVKMVHNGIEYAVMQAIAECFHFMRDGLSMCYDHIQETFASWSESEELGSFLVEITSEILKHEEGGTPFVDLIKDTALQKGTGKWTSQVALDLGVPADLLASAVFERMTSADKEGRVGASKIFKRKRVKFDGSSKYFVKLLKEALYATVLMAYSQGFKILRTCASSDSCSYPIDLVDVAGLWRAGCIIRSKVLDDVMVAFAKEPDQDLVLTKKFSKDVVAGAEALREVVSTAISHGVPVPIFSTMLADFDSMRLSRLPSTALIQAMRDYFGAHTYERNDKEGTFHTRWSSDMKEVKK